MSFNSALAGGCFPWPVALHLVEGSGAAGFSSNGYLLNSALATIARAEIDKTMDKDGLSGDMW